MSAPDPADRAAAKPSAPTAAGGGATPAPPAPPAPALPPRLDAAALVAMVVAQVGMHAAMAGVRLAVPLQALGEGSGPWRIGLLLSSFAFAQMLCAVPAGRYADRHGYHRPVRVAAIAAALGCAIALAAGSTSGVWRDLLWVLGALLLGGGANAGVIAIQRAAGQAAQGEVDRVRIFSWLGVAPSLANVVGPVLAGVLIDAVGFRGTYVALCALPLVSLLATRFVPEHVSRPTWAAGAPPQPAAWTLLRVPGMKRLLGVNWLMSAAWDVHAFAVPILGHGLGFSATTIGLILGTFTTSVTGVRLLMPAIAHRIRGPVILYWAMWLTAGVFAAYPFAKHPLLMAGLAVILGLAMGSVQPMILSELHRITPEGRHGQSYAFRSMAINASAFLLPLVLGAAGTLVGAGALFWGMGVAVGAGARLGKGIGPKPVPAVLAAESAFGNEAAPPTDGRPDASAARA